jgi:molybdopterin molybdotransferase
VILTDGDLVTDGDLAPGLLSLKDALSRMQDFLNPITETETVTLLDGLDRILATDIRSNINVPGYDNSAMDGYALRHADALLGKPLTLIGTSLAGHAFAGAVGDHECVGIMTGAVIPAGADCVVMQENTLLNNNQLNITTLPHLAENIRRAGDDIKQGAIVVTKGHRLTPVNIGLLASLGINTLEVYRQIKVAVISTGDELTPPDETLAQNCIYDSNRYALIALLQRLKVECIDLGLVVDEPSAIAQAFAKGVEVADVIISSGGVSVGAADYTKDVLSEMGTINFWKVAIKPGKPFAFGSLAFNLDSRKRAWFFGLPGNPVSAVVTYHQLVLPALRYLAGEVFTPNIIINAIAGHDIKKKAGRLDFQRGVLRNDILDKEKNIVFTTGNQSSGILTSLAQANCYIVLEQERGFVKEGEPVNIILFDQFLL